ncbi:L-cystatin-like [Parasteatoda tepidariorum]|uniref:L-cystatin-like n=1 Tax=Parasteatoda tepidariorum TaxID=114398 RepID=UPI00077F9519|nr:L-cystatin-like [Parasteatoda tepidariorum]
MFKEILLLSLVAFAACGLLGGWETADVDDSEVKVAAGHAAEALSKQFASKYHHRLVKVLKAKKQVVAGMNFRLDVVVGLTTCQKSEMSHEDAGDCELQDTVSTYKKCTVVVNRDLKDNHKMVTSGCILISRDEV